MLCLYIFLSTRKSTWNWRINFFLIHMVFLQVSNLRHLIIRPTKPPWLQPSPQSCLQIKKNKDKKIKESQVILPSISLKCDIAKFSIDELHSHKKKSLATSISIPRKPYKKIYLRTLLKDGILLLKTTEFHESSSC